MDKLTAKVWFSSAESRQNPQDVSNPDFPIDMGRRVPVTMLCNLELSGGLEQPISSVGPANITLSIEVLRFVDESVDLPFSFFFDPDHDQPKALRFTLEPWPEDEETPLESSGGA